ncbi:hypothetical protein ACOQFO_07305 [Ureibacillus sp. MALMAid1270]|uniref:hypothetical protein n=1 Tax=Ureibacillus sp. MALMAid1270 TaxID=3411629 RepID=UPI003BA79DA9
MKKEKTKEQRKLDRELVEKYHQKVTEEALERLYESFQQWKVGQLHYGELTDQIHEFHKYNQKIWSKFNRLGWRDEILILEAKKEFGLLTEEEESFFIFDSNEE